jgi:hypothetical protein
LFHQAERLDFLIKGYLASVYNPSTVANDKVLINNLIRIFDNFNELMNLSTPLTFTADPHTYSTVSNLRYRAAYLLSQMYDIVKHPKKGNITIPSHTMQGAMKELKASLQN